MAHLRFGVNPIKEKALLNRMKELGVDEVDLVERFVRSSGKGGQRLNKSSTCVYLKHVPTNIEVKIQRERFQGVNRFLARRALVEKIESRILGVKTDRQKNIEKIQKQKRRRFRRAFLGRHCEPREAG